MDITTRALCPGVISTNWQTYGMHIQLRYKHETWFYGNIFRITGPFCEEPRVTGGFPQKGSVMRSLDVSCDYFPAQRASNAENGSIWWRHHDLLLIRTRLYVFTGTHQLDELLKEDLHYNGVTWTPRMALQLTGNYTACGPLNPIGLLISKCFHIMKSPWVTDHCSNDSRQQKYTVPSLLRPSWHYWCVLLEIQRGGG